MNLDIRTLALSQSECTLLTTLLRMQLPDDIGKVAASESEAAKKMELAVLTQNYHGLCTLLTWGPRDAEAGRAYRQLTTQGLMKINEVMLAASTHPQIGALEVLQKPRAKA